jgi:threonine/homoserine/homoserine lactone efflux protein
VMRSSEIFTMVRVLGAAYLITLGAAMLWRARLGLRHEDPATARPVAVPQVLGAHDISLGPVLALATIHVAAMALWLTSWSAVLVRGRRWTRPRRFRTPWIAPAARCWSASGSAPLSPSQELRHSAVPPASPARHGSTPIQPRPS